MDNIYIVTTGNGRVIDYQMTGSPEDDPNNPAGVYQVTISHHVPPACILNLVVAESIAYFVGGEVITYAKQT